MFHWVLLKSDNIGYVSYSVTPSLIYWTHTQNDPYVFVQIRITVHQTVMNDGVVH